MFLIIMLDSSGGLLNVLTDVMRSLVVKHKLTDHLNDNTEPKEWTNDYSVF